MVDGPHYIWYPGTRPTPEPARQPQPRRDHATWLSLAVFIGVCQAVGLISAQLGDSRSAWYLALQQPAWSPPDWIYAPVWTALYAVMGIAAWLVWRRRGFAGAPLAMGLFGLQLFLNGLWTPIFFGLQAPGLALLDLSALWLAILATTVVFARHTATAAWLMVPYLAWTTYAWALNWQIWRLNL